MATKPLTTDAIAFTEKKMDMTLEDIIKMSKRNTSTTKKQRVSNKSKKFLNTGAQSKPSKIQRFMDSRSALRQGALARRRSNFQGNPFPLAIKAAQKAAVVPIRNSAFNRYKGPNVNKSRVRALPIQRKTANGSFTVKPPPQVQTIVPKQRPQTLDSRFANMKRMRDLYQQNNNAGRSQRQQWSRSQFGR